MRKCRFYYIYILLLLPIFVNAQELKVITFNIRSDLKGDRQNQWKYRKQLVTDFLVRINPDILCFQEAEENQIKDIKKHFPMLEVIGDYSEKRPYYKRPVPIFVHKKKFKIVNTGCFGLSEAPGSIGFKGWDAKYARMAIWANLKVRETGKTIFVINTHLDNIGKLARLNGIKQIVDTIPLLGKSDIVILAGDFNSREKTNVYNYVIRNELKDTYYQCTHFEGVNYTFHGYGKREIKKRGKIDYIFVSKQVKVLNVYIPKEDPIGGIYLSDHNPVIATIGLN